MHLGLIYSKFTYTLVRSSFNISLCLMVEFVCIVVYVDTTICGSSIDVLGNTSILWKKCIFNTLLPIYIDVSVDTSTCYLNIIVCDDT